MTFYLMKDGIGYYEMHHLSQRLSFIFDVCSGQALWDHMIPYREISRVTLVETAGAKIQEQWQKTGPQVNPYPWLVLSFTSNGNERVIQMETKNGEVHG